MPCLNVEILIIIFSACTDLETGYLEKDGATFCNATYIFDYTEETDDDQIKFECTKCEEDQAVSEFGR